MTNQTRLASADELESIFQRELVTDRWAATETSYALAVRYRDLGDWPKSREWVEQCLRLLEGFPSETEEQVATSRTSVGGVQLPTYLHSGVVRDRFGDLG
ncbi:MULTISPECIES: hypothetical protein [Streptomyces]|uniref:hypothetical protein n=1 Tax=Streptomyces TaxID=1883 RepID=UPI00017E80BC|nr:MULTISPECIES: hypothetical protein [unclassified Streptomyces]AKL67184.1 hypothetical protein M444_19325 [Streptomyces sp. Mg1]EDX26039.1 hypothetical protein SSAG_05850 [Streptomyces sp. Mg1]MCY0923002.1 hypothetical protein [Streptomyces sp. H27-G5]